MTHIVVFMEDYYEDVIDAVGPFDSEATAKAWALNNRPDVPFSVTQLVRPG